MFRNEPFTDFGIQANRQAFQAALDRLNQQLNHAPILVAPQIGGERLSGEESFTRTDPSRASCSVAQVAFASINDANNAVSSLQQGFPSWRGTSFERRAEILRKAAKQMRDSKFEVSALLVREVGKSWKEADGDVAEAIDFCDYYAEEMLRLGPPLRLGNLPGEENCYFYQPRGIGLVIAPWNFPFAIACGMAVAGLVTGNCVILKPSEQSSAVAQKLVEILYSAGIPHNALAFLPGRGEKIGAHLVQHASIDFICFTGSKAVGLEIINKASVVRPGQVSVKRVIAEMGGKNAIIVDEDADLDEAIKGIIQSAFGYAGQKCSACSRAIIVGSAYEPFLERLKHAAQDIITGEACDSSTFLGPVVDEEAQRRIISTIEAAEKEYKLLYRGNPAVGGSYVPIAIFRDVPTKAKIWNDEIFGPVLACTKAQDFQQAVSLANQCEYALTGAVFSRSPNNLNFARENFRVGNLYINRGSTGAMVYRQPFGGFKMSGIGSKAGGPDYLVQFMEPRTITENTMRRGFAPE